MEQHTICIYIDVGPDEARREYLLARTCDASRSQRADEQLFKSRYKGHLDFRRRENAAVNKGGRTGMRDLEDGIKCWRQTEELKLRFCSCEYVLFKQALSFQRFRVPVRVVERQPSGLNVKGQVVMQNVVSNRCILFQERNVNHDTAVNH